MSETPDTTYIAPTATAELPPVMPPTHDDLRLLEQRLTLQIASANGARADEIRQLREVVTGQRQDIQSIRQHQETQDRRADALENEVRPAIQEIKASNSRIDTSLNSIRELLERDRKTVDTNSENIRILQQQQVAGVTATATIDRDVGDLRTRLSEVVSPLAVMVLGDAKQPSMLERLESIQQKIESDRQQFYASLGTLKKDVEPVILTVAGWKQQITDTKTFLKSPRGMAFVFGISALVIELFSKIDLLGIAHTIFTGGK